MEEFLAWLAKEIVPHLMLNALWYLASALLIGVGAMLTALIYGRHYKREKREQVARDKATGERIAALEAEIGRLGGGGSVVVGGTTVVVNAGDYSSVIQELRDELKAKELELLDLRTLVGRLTPKPVPGTSATYVKLPEGARVVVMDDDSIRVALPVSVEEHIGIADTVEAVLNPGKEDDS